ncbi:MAG: hypothetical protein JW940_18825, partial [Polyangiaceae bacterium]|nr:hypothetical protein [Polyangiaceae bacterium]
MAITLAAATASCSAADSAELGEAAAGQGGDATAAGTGGGSTLDDSSAAVAGAPSNGGAEGEEAVETGSDAIWSALAQGFTLTAVGGMSWRDDTFAYVAETRILERTCLSFCYENGNRITPSEPMVTSAALSEAQAAELTAALDT